MRKTNCQRNHFFQIKNQYFAFFCSKNILILLKNSKRPYRLKRMPFESQTIKNMNLKAKNNLNSLFTAFYLLIKTPKPQKYEQ